MADPIQVWAFYDAPKEYQELSSHGGDEDWVALVPVGYNGQWIPWLEEPWFGCCSVSFHPLPDGREVRIAAHA